MSVLNQSGEEPVECPLCMEPLEVDDLNFFPCTCGYQICRFCWHRIRTDENGLCPACRKAYPEDPADFKPLSKEDFARIKAEKRQKNQQKKQKITENRKSLGNVRVVQKNLVFVLGLPTRLADAEVLKRHEYFGKFGKILKVVVNQSTAYAGNQGPCASAYVTYSRSEDALRAIQAVNNISVEGRIVKTSLGTTKYCSHFMKNQSCPKTDCMYLHEMGDPEASFTKEEMQQGKHQEFEKKLHDQLTSSTQQIYPASQHKFCSNFFPPRKPSPSPPSVQLNQYSSSDSSPTSQTVSSSRPSSSNDRTSPTMLGSCNSASQACTNISMTAKEEWPSLRAYSPTELSYTDSTNDTKEGISDNLSDQSDSAENADSYNGKICKKHGKKRNTQSDDRDTEENDLTIFSDTSDSSETNETQTSDTLQSVLRGPPCNSKNAHYHICMENSSDTDELQTLDEQKQPHSSPSPPSVSSKVSENVDTDNNSFFSVNNFQSGSNGTTNTASQNEWLFNGEQPRMPDVLPPVRSNEDWQAAFGFSNELVDDDLGFDPFKETQKALAELIENEKQNCGYFHHNYHSNHHHSGNNHNHNNNNIHNNNSHQHNNHHHHHHHHQNSGSRDSTNLMNNNNNNVYQKRFITMQQNNRLANCTKLLDELRIGSVIPPRTHVPPPGFSNTPNHMNAFGLGIPRTGNKILPFTQQTLTAFQQHSTPSGWDWSSIDPAIVTTGQHCDLYASQPPPGFTLTPTIDSKYMFNNFL